MEEKKKFHALTPMETMELPVYEEALEFAFSEDSVRNVALSGAYGSGKSSVIRSYERSDAGQKRKFLHISLARFDEQTGETEKGDQPDGGTAAEQPAADSEDSRRVVNILEGKILNQLLHQITPDSILQSEFKIKRERKWYSFLGQAVGILGFALLLLYVLKFSAWSSIVHALERDSLLYQALEWTAGVPSRILAAALSAVLAGIGLYRILRDHNFQNIFKKIDLKGHYNKDRKVVKIQNRRLHT